MKTAPVYPAWIGCVLCCALTGCSTTLKSKASGPACCTATAPLPPLPPQYHNYTPPSAILLPIPTPPTGEVPPVPEVVPPSPAETNTAPNKIPDDLQSFNLNRQPRFH